MNWRSPRFLLLLTVISLLVVGIGVVAALVFQSRHAKVSTQHPVVQKTVIPGNERQVTQMYNQAVMKQDWATVYASTSRIVTGDLTQEQYAQILSQQIQNGGTISSIVMTSNPEVITNADEAPYFIVQEQVTTVKNGKTQTQSLTSIFILEDGAWKYWFSKKV